MCRAPNHSSVGRAALGAVGAATMELAHEEAAPPPEARDAGGNAAVAADASAPPAEGDVGLPSEPAGGEPAGLTHCGSLVSVASAPAPWDAAAVAGEAPARETLPAVASTTSFVGLRPERAPISVLLPADQDNIIMRGPTPPPTGFPPPLKMTMARRRAARLPGARLAAATMRRKGWAMARRFLRLA